MIEQAATLEREGRLAAAAEIYERVLADEPHHAAALRGLALLRLKDRAEAAALALARRAVVAAPAVAANHTVFARVLAQREQFEAALAAHAIAVRLAPDDATVWYRRGLTEQRAGRLVEAEKSLQRALDRDGTLQTARDALAQVWFEGGRVEEAVEALRAAIASGEARSLTHDMLLFYLHFLPSSTRASLHAEHVAWDTMCAAALRCAWAPHPNDRSPERRLRIGYVSADFREHPVAPALLALLAAHDRREVEVVAYSGVRVADVTTARCRELADEWRDAVNWTDAELAQRVREDRIDVLVDLSLHTTGHRLLAFARRPAPVQVTWAGYPGTTGLAAMDYRLTDRFLEPPEWGEPAGSETPVRLPDSFWCYDPTGEELEVNALPAGVDGAVTFGCLNKCAKINPLSVARWAGVLRAVPRSRMIVLATSDVSRTRIERLFEAEGITAARIEFVGWHPRPDYLALHHRIDVALDPMPYGGHVTLIDGLWMGVPTVSLPGETAVSRAGLSLLTTAGLEDWVAKSPENFVRIAVEQTRDLDRLAALRAGLRARLRGSALMDGPRFARGVEAAFRAMWRRWCAALGARS